jgi:RHH-type transcriptional regulator, proline utilization regulon repressor / proline dehydrogenase / delta 1-pyrroline-5-carboxylate dehydrogenase
VTDFRNEPLLDLRIEGERVALLQALVRLDASLPLSVPILVGPVEVPASTVFESTDPGEPGRVVAIAARGGQEDVDRAVRVAALAATEWASESVETRARAVERAADLLSSDRRELAALQVRECGKPWVEADADVAEAIDHLRYAAVQARPLAQGRDLIQAPGERNSMRYRPRGVVAAIGPWNFPLAIPAGLVAGALVTGNAVILKPAEQAPASGLMLVRALRRAGVPNGAIALLPGLGDAGEALVCHPGVQTIAFTGSEAVGLRIVRTAAETPDGQHHVKRVIAEMGGKNAIIVDSDADLDQAVPDIVRSAFSYAGQKCSAASRVLVHEAIANDLERRLVGAVEVLRVGQAEDFACDVSPLIDQESLRRVDEAIATGERDGRIATGPAEVPSRGWFRGPTVICDLPRSSVLTSEEIFGPVLTIERVATVDEALDMVVEARFALTGAIFSRNPRVVDRVITRSPVGNLYVNRHITGALVGRQPFGGNRRSGIGAKVGGPDYLLQFVDAQVVTENTLRHGIVME